VKKAAHKVSSKILTTEVDAGQKSSLAAKIGKAESWSVMEPSLRGYGQLPVLVSGAE